MTASTTFPFGAFTSSHFELCSPTRSLVPSLVMPRGVPMQLEVVPVMLNEAVLELEVGKEFQKRSSLFPVRDATTFQIGRAHV